jgi:hypothetical protein
VRVSLAAFQAAAKVSQKNHCRHRREIARLTRAEQREYGAAIHDVSIQLPAILRVLRERGLRVNKTSLHYHRHRQCITCFGGVA